MCEGEEHTNPDTSAFIVEHGGNKKLFLHCKLNTRRSIPIRSELTASGARCSSRTSWRDYKPTKSVEIAYLFYDTVTANGSNKPEVFADKDYLDSVKQMVRVLKHG